MTESARGLVAGLAGTAAMTATLLVDHFLGNLPGEVPPRKVGRRSEEAVGIREHLSRPAFEASWLAQHFAYGAAAGVVYEQGWRRLRMPEPVPAGPDFGLALWTIGYAGWVPLAGLYPPPTEDRPRRAAGILAHHLVYGTSGPRRNGPSSEIIGEGRGFVPRFPRGEGPKGPAWASMTASQNP